MASAVFTDTVTGHAAQPFDIYVHPAPESHAVIINVPGYAGSIDGYNNKYRKLGQHLSAKGIGTFIQMPNLGAIKTPSERHAMVYGEGLIADLKAVCMYAMYTLQTSNAKKRELYLVGFSAGGGAVAAVTRSFSSAVTKVLLMEPATNVGTDHIVRGLASYSGELYIVTGSGHDAIGPSCKKHFYDTAPHARRRKMHVIPDCDHQFKGKTHGQIMAKAYEWAFAGDTSFPDPEGGLVLYE